MGQQYKPKYQLVIFDVDGTLLDTTQGIVEAVKYTIKCKNLPEIEEEKILQFIGPPIQDSFHIHYGLEGNELQETAEIFRNYYKEHTLLLAKPYDGVYDVLEKLKEYDIVIAVATYKRQDYARKLLKHFHVDRYSPFLYGADNNNILKKADIINLCIKEAGIHSQEKVLMVGDSEHDAKGAKSVGVDFLGVTYGFGYKTQEQILKDGAIGACENIHELLNYVFSCGAREKERYG